MNDLELKIKDLNKEGFSGLKKILYKRGTFTKYPFLTSIAVSIGFVLIISYVDIDRLYNILKLTAELLLSFFPNLLGFSLGGYALVVGFSNLELIKKASKVDRHSVYQILNAIFSLSIIFQVFTTIICFIVSWIIKVEFLEIFGLYVEWVAHTINAILLLILSFGALYSLSLTPYVVINLFTLSQINSLYLTVENLKEKSTVRKKE